MDNVVISAVRCLSKCFANLYSQNKYKRKNHIALFFQELENKYELLVNLITELLEYPSSVKDLFLYIFIINYTSCLVSEVICPSGISN